MGVIQVQLPDELKALIDREVAEGRVASEAEFLVEAARRFVEDLAIEGEIAEMVRRADGDVAAGRYVTVATPEDSQGLRDVAMDRLRARLASDAEGR
jgi:Arc/MetJ-type ribon-helix-helix transcriptional regulator